MDPKLHSLFRELDSRYHDRKNKQNLSRDDKKRWYWLGQSNELGSTIALIKKIFQVS